MAFTYRNPLEAAINQLPTKYSDQILSLTTDSIVSRVEDLNKFFSYSLKKEVEEALIKKGIELAPLSFKTHSHPACKTIENHLIYRVLPTLIKKTPSIALLSMRDEKSDRIIKLRNFAKYGAIKSITNLNMNIDWKDRYRYENGWNLPQNLKENFLNLRKECEKNGWFPKTAFVHDELHFWTPKDVVNFFKINPEISSLLGTVVVPPELLCGETVSKNPRIYTFEVDYRDIFFFPDGVASEGYRQKKSNSLWPLKYSCIKGSGIKLRVSILYSVYAHHIISIDRGNYYQKEFYFDKPECILNSEADMISTSLRDSIIERQTISSILLYLICLKKPNVESAMAKLRQLEKRDLFPDEAFLVQTVSSVFIKYGLSDDIDKNIFKKAWNKMIGTLPGFLFEFIAKKQCWQEAFRFFLKEIAIKHFHIWRETYECQFTLSDDMYPTSIEDREPQNYSLSLKDFQTGFPFNLTSETFLCDGDTFLGSSVYKTVFKRRFSPEPILKQNGLRSSTGLFLLSDFSDFSDGVYFPEDQVSSTGVVLDSFMVIPDDFKSVLKYNERKNKCVFDAIAESISENPEEILNLVLNFDISEDLLDAIEEDQPLDIKMIIEVSEALDLILYVGMDGEIRKFNLRGSRRAGIILLNGHATCMNHKQLEAYIAKEMSKGKGVCENEGDFGSLFMNYGSAKVNFKDALKLWKSISRGATGILRETNPKIIKVFEFMETFLSKMDSENLEIEYPFGLTVGAPGSGKSHGVSNFLSHNPMESSMVISPRRALAEDWRAKTAGTSHKVYTFETALFSAYPGLKNLFFDELTLYPPGFVDLQIIMTILYKNRFLKGGCLIEKLVIKALKRKEFVLPRVGFIGDPIQSYYYGETDSSLLSKKTCMATILEGVKEKVNYLWYSMRLPKGFENVIDIQCLGKEDFEKFKVFSELSAVKAQDYDAILVASQEDKRNSTVCIAPMTFGESQGLTFDKKVLICISRDTLKVSTNALLVALTRSRKGFDFFLMTDMTFKDIIKITKKKLLGYILENSKISPDRLFGLVNLNKMNLIKKSGNLEDKAFFDPFILPEVQPNYPMPDEIEIEASELQPTWMKTHLPINSIDPLVIEIFEKMRTKEKREFWHISRGSSQQFSDTDENLIENVMGYGFRFDAIFPRHNGQDDVTFFEGVKKRLKFSNPRRERSKLEESRNLACGLLDVFMSKLPESFEVTNADIEFGLNSFNEKRSEKTQGMWEAHKERSDIDWPLNHIFLFMKAQLCTKEEKMFTTAKAGQTLACFHHLVLFKFGPMLRAIERAFLRACGSSYYIHSGKNFFALNHFVVSNAHLFQGSSIESDYEAFDSSQDSVILAFEEALLKKIGVSQGFISDYITLKLNLGCRLGSFAIMRFTGEFCTFLFNTFANMLFTFLKYDVKSSRDRLLFAGDDMASLGSLRPQKGKESKMLEYFSLKAKEEVKKCPTFCGWILTPEGILKSPKLVWSRICLMKQKGLIKQCMDSYYLESIYAYNLGEKLFVYLSEIDIEYHYCVSRFFNTNKDQLCGEAKRLAFGFTERFGSTCQLLKSMSSESRLKNQRQKLMLLKPQTCIRMPTSSIRRPSTAYDGLRATLRSLAYQLMGSYSLTLKFLMTLKLNLYLVRLGSFRTCMLGQLLSILALSFQTLEIKVERSHFMTDLLQFQLKDISARTNSASVMDQLVLLCGQNIVYLLLTNIWQIALEYSFRQMIFILVMNAKFLVWILVACTDLQAVQDSSFLTMRLVDGHNKKSLEQNYCKFQKTLTPKFLGMKAWHDPHQLVFKLSCIKEASFCLVETLGKDAMLSQLIDRSNGWLKTSWLSQLRKKLIKLEHEEKKKTKMSVQAAIHTTIRNYCDAWMWVNHIDPDRAIIPADADMNALQDGHAANWRLGKIHFQKYLFGNIALLGSSGKTAWPDVAINLPVLNLRVGNTATPLNLVLNLSVVVPALENWKRTHENQILRGSTLRQICEVYANMAYIFLKENYSRGVATNLYIKWPRAFEAAPWVAFDFASGLPMHELMPDEKKVIDRLTKRLFRTEGQKGIFEASQETNIDLEG